MVNPDQIRSENYGKIRVSMLIKSESVDYYGCANQTVVWETVRVQRSCTQPLTFLFNFFGFQKKF
jgi:hypothetical protein